MSKLSDIPIWGTESFEEQPVAYQRPSEEELRPRIPEPADLYIKPGSGECLIELSRGYYTIVDLIDYERLRGYAWFTSFDSKGKVYARRKGIRSDGEYKRRDIYLHREITGILKEPGLVVDHDNGNSLDNRRKNLLVCQPTRNARNNEAVYGVVGYRGVCEWRSSRDVKKYQAQMRIGMEEGESGYLGIFKTAIEAAKAYDNAVIMALFKGRHIEMRFLRKLLNFPEDWIVNSSAQCASAEDSGQLEDEIPF